MVATRRATRRSESKAGSPAFHAAAKQPSMEDNTPLRTTRSRSRMISQAKSISEFHPAEVKASETESDTDQPLEARADLNASKAGGLADTAAELQADGDLSEAESTCSSVSGLQTPLFVRITRRRRIVIPCTPETSLKSRQNRKAVPNEGSNCQDNDDASEAESCSSVLSGMKNPRSTRKSRRQGTKVYVSPVCEVQTEEVSDAESWCSGVSLETSGAFKRVTRSMQLKLQAASQAERKNDVLREDAEMTECANPSEAIVISDSEELKDSDLDTRQTPSVSTVWRKEHPSPSKTKQLSKSLACSDPKQIFSSNDKAMASERNNDLSEQKKLKDDDYESEHTGEVQCEKATRKSISEQISVEINEKVETPEEVCDQPIANESPSKIISISPCDPRILDKSNELLIKARSNENMRLKSKKVIQNCLHHREDIIKTDESSAIDSPSSQTLKNNYGCRSSTISTDSGGSLKEAVAESSSHATRITGHQKDMSISLLTSDESDEFENSDLANFSEMTVNYVEENSQSTLGEDRSNSEELFVIDKTPGLDSHKEYYFEDKQSKDSSELEESEEEFIDEDEDVLSTNNELVSFSSSIDPGLNIKQFGGLYITFDSGKQSHGVLPLKEKKKDELLQRSIITPDFEKKECVPPLRESVHQLKKQRRAERAKTTGDGWFGMKAPEMTDELKNDLKALKMRAAIDPKRFYKKNDREGLPRYFQIGTVVDNPADFYHARIPKKQRKKTIVEELLADSEFRRYNKRKYQDIIAEKAALAAGKKNRKKKKFHK